MKRANNCQNMVSRVALAGLCFITANACGSGQPLEQPAATLRGVSLSPRSNGPEDFADFFVQAVQAGEVVMWAGDWMELSATQAGGPTVVTELATTYHYLPLVEVQFFTQATGELLRPLDEPTRETYRQSAADFAEKYQPKYLGLGIEVNVLYEKSAPDFEAFVQFFSEEEQAQFVETFFRLTADLSAELAIWSFLYDPETSVPFNTMGLLRRSDGAAKAAWDVWKRAAGGFSEAGGLIY